MRIDTRLRSCATASKVTLALAEVPAGELPAEVADAPLDTRRRRSEHATGFLLHEERTELERDGIEAAGEHDARAARLRRRVMPVDHLLQPDRLAAEIHIVGARRDAGGKQIGAVELVGTYRCDHQLRLIDHRAQRRRIGRVRHD
ncbi:hypothetical protein ABIF90_000199 [Bradyrhizobium japonicum]